MAEVEPDRELLEDPASKPFWQACVRALTQNESEEIASGRILHHNCQMLPKQLHLEEHEQGLLRLAGSVLAAADTGLGLDIGGPSLGRAAINIVCVARTP